MKISARNQIKGRIVRIVRGSVNTEVILDIGNGVEIAAQITEASVERLGLKEGAEAYALIKADNVMIGVEH